MTHILSKALRFFFLEASSYLYLQVTCQITPSPLQLGSPDHVE